MSDGWATQMRKGFVEFCILAIVAKSDAYGYAILKRLNEMSVLTMTEGTLYLALNRMTKEGLLSSYKAASTEGPPRRYYVLSADGRERLALMRGYWSSMKTGIDTLLLTLEEDQENDGD